MASKSKKPPMQKPMTVAEMRKLLMQREAQLAQCVEYNRQWETVAQGLERQKKELLAVVERQTAEIEYWKSLLIGKGITQQ